MNREKKVEEDVIKVGGTDRRDKLCQCIRCKLISRCTPINDFYVLSEDDEGPLFCESCVLVLFAYRERSKHANA